MPDDSELMGRVCYLRVRALRHDSHPLFVRDEKATVVEIVDRDGKPVDVAQYYIPPGNLIPAAGIRGDAAAVNAAEAKE